MNKKITEKSISKCLWYEEVSEYLNIDRKILKNIVPVTRRMSKLFRNRIKRYTEILENKLEGAKSIGKLNDQKLVNSKDISDEDKSKSWINYIYLCIHGERNAFRRMELYKNIIDSIVDKKLKNKDNVVVLDYGCGTSLLTRMISEKYRNKVKTISADVNKYAVKYSVTRNRIYNDRAEGLLIEDVMSTIELKNIDVILAYAVFEHLPNSYAQIDALIESLSDNGILIENYSGSSIVEPHKSDTNDSYKNRDRNIDNIRNKMNLLYGMLPKKQNGVYEEDYTNRFWYKGDINIAEAKEIKETLDKSYNIINRMFSLSKKICREIRSL